MFGTHVSLGLGFANANRPITEAAAPKKSKKGKYPKKEMSTDCEGKKLAADKSQALVTEKKLGPPKQAAKKAMGAAKQPAHKTIGKPKVPAGA